MHFDINFNTMLEALAVLGIAGIFRQLMTLNLSVGRMKVWQEQHEKQDNERHETVMAIIERS